MRSGRTESICPIFEKVGPRRSTVRRTRTSGLRPASSPWCRFARRLAIQGARRPSWSSTVPKPSSMTTVTIWR